MKRAQEVASGPHSKVTILAPADALPDPIETVYAPSTAAPSTGPLKFGSHDMVLGPRAGSFGGELRVLQKRAGGQLLQDMGPPYKPPDVHILDWSIRMMNQTINQGSKIRFDMTLMNDVKGALQGTGKYANTVTAGELQYIRDNWARFKDKVVFYSHDAKIPPPPGFSK